MCFLSSDRKIPEKGLTTDYGYSGKSQFLECFGIRIHQGIFGNKRVGRVIFFSSEFSLPKIFVGATGV